MRPHARVFDRQDGNLRSSVDSALRFRLQLSLELWMLTGTSNICFVFAGLAKLLLYVGRCMRVGLQRRSLELKESSSTRDIRTLFPLSLSLLRTTSAVKIGLAAIICHRATTATRPRGRRG